MFMFRMQHCNRKSFIKFKPTIVRKIRILEITKKYISNFLFIILVISFFIYQEKYYIFLWIAFFKIKLTVLIWLSSYNEMFHNDITEGNGLEKKQKKKKGKLKAWNVEIPTIMK